MTNKMLLMYVMLFFMITACTTPRVENTIVREYVPVYVPIRVDNNLFICPVHPAVPKSMIDEDGNRVLPETDVANFIVDLSSAHRKCYASLEAIKELQRTLSEIVTEKNPDGVDIIIPDDFEDMDNLEVVFDEEKLEAE